MTTVLRKMSSILRFSLFSMFFLASCTACYKHEKEAGQPVTCLQQQLLPERVQGQLLAGLVLIVLCGIVHSLCMGKEVQGSQSGKVA